jgi:NACHT domain
LFAFLDLEADQACSSSVIHHLEKLYDSDPYTALAYFYFSFSETEKQSTENMLRSLIVQLCGGRPDTPKPLLDLHLYRDKNLEPGLEKLEETFQASTRDFKSVYLVVDALDECPRANDERDKLLKCLENVHKWTLTNLHVLYTSRPEPDIEAKLAPLFSGPATSIIDLQKRREEVDRDIGTFIDQKIASSDFRSWPPKTKKDVKAALTDKADGMYDAAYYQFEISS